MPETERFTIGSDVSCTDGPCGTLARVVVDPVARMVTHLIVEPRRGHGPARLVPAGLVASAAGEIRLRCTTAEFDSLDPAEQSQFIASDADVPDYRQTDVVAWPYYGYRGARGDLVTTEAIPPGEVEVRRGDHVHATDGRIGQVEGLVIDPESNHVTHVLLQQGHLWGHKEVAIPIGAVRRAADRIEVSLTKQQVEDLPPVESDHRPG